mgnify:CR=1 FL=1
MFNSQYSHSESKNETFLNLFRVPFSTGISGSFSTGISGSFSTGIRGSFSSDIKGSL